jgi:hypothetical protein
MHVTDRESNEQRPGRMRGIIHRWHWWPTVLVPIAVGGFAWGLGRGPWVTLGAAAAAVVIAAVLRPRGPNRWTE